ncbi:uncharacterized protein EI90DRAFT_3288618 [Cantharellus anzutake]|uniref:uncharacterized protein n=1 Tax=Cantharellus anzutake TaxID=1750568 RepID=UPI00190401C1|nr:uncharacterized protein EI90DRAFT_3288618 [Cantharellus anzutake]KAF8333576.1 hypothetical protein EI90DRAFT_3288618 [Cantharellus anzutake]
MARTPETVYDNSYSIEKIQAEARPLPGPITYKVNVGGKAKPQLLSLDLEYEDWKSAISATPGLPENKRFRPEITWKLGTALKMQDLQTVDDNQEYQLMVHEIVMQHEKDGKQWLSSSYEIYFQPEKDQRKTGQKSTKKKQGSQKARKKRSKTGQDDSSSSDSDTDSGSADSTMDESDSDHSHCVQCKKPAKLALWQIEDLLHEKHHFCEQHLKNCYYCSGSKASHLQTNHVDTHSLAVVLGDHMQWWISACEHINAVIGIVHCKALWSYRDEGVRYNTCKDVFEWLDAIYAEWTSIPMVRLYELACEHYLKSLPMDLIVPPAFATFCPSLSPLPLDLVPNTAQANDEQADNEPELDKKNKGGKST